MSGKVDNNVIGIGRPPGNGVLKVGLGGVGVHIVRHAVVIQIQLCIGGEIVDRLFGKSLVVQGAIGEIGCHLGRIPEVVSGKRAAPGNDDGFRVVDLRYRGEDLNAIVLVFRNINLPVRCNGNTPGVGKLARSRPRCAESGNKLTVGRKFLYAIIACVGNQKVAASVNGNSARSGKLSGSASLAAPFVHKCAAGTEFLNPVVERVGNIDVPAAVNGQIMRKVELTILRAGTAVRSDKLMGAAGLIV